MCDAARIFNEVMDGICSGNVRAFVGVLEYVSVARLTAPFVLPLIRCHIQLGVKSCVYFPTRTGNLMLANSLRVRRVYLAQ